VTYFLSFHMNKILTDGPADDECDDETPDTTPSAAPAKKEHAPADTGTRDEIETLIGMIGKIPGENLPPTGPTPHTDGPDDDEE